jgi:putative hydrolase of the HAD superfamily
MKYRHLFFDLDHTLWDFDANSRITLETLHQTLQLASLGIDDFDRFHQNYLIHNERLWDRYRKGTIKVDELRWKRFALALLDFKIGNDALAKQMAEAFLELLPTRTALFPHTKELLQYLKEKGYTMHLITNGFEATQQSKISNSGIADYFVEMITSEGSQSLKPHREIFEYAMHKTGAIPAQSIMIGDDPEVDIKGAMNFGMDQVFVNHVEKVIDFSPTYEVRSLKELENIF